MSTTEPPSQTEKSADDVPPPLVVPPIITAEDPTSGSGTTTQLTADSDHPVAADAISRTQTQQIHYKQFSKNTVYSGPVRTRRLRRSFLIFPRQWRRREIYPRQYLANMPIYSQTKYCPLVICLTSSTPSIY